MKEFFRQYKYYMLVPFIIVLAGLAALILLTEDSSFGPFIYAIF